MPPVFAIVTFRKTGPIKTWAAMRAANVHNARTKPLDHAVPGAPGPRHLIGTRDLVADVKRRLVIAKIDPDRLRKNGVIAYEAILTASAEFFENGNEAERAAQLAAWTKAQVDWANDRYGPLRVASMVLHQDEKTPHIHLVVLPLEMKADKRRKHRDLRWSLVGRTISGPGQFDRAQDEYAEAMKTFGLSRGVRGSGRKHEPVPVYLKRMAAKEREVDDARQAVSRDAIAVDDARQALIAARKLHAAMVAQAIRADGERRAGFAREHEAMLRNMTAEREAVAAEREAVEKLRAAHDAKVAEEVRLLAADRAAVAQQLAELSRDKIALGRNEAQQRADALKMKRAMEAAATLQNEAEQDRTEAAMDRARARTMADKIELHRKHLLPTIQAAADFRKRLDAMRDCPLTPAATDALTVAATLQAAAQRLTPPAYEMRPAVLASYARIRQNGAAIGM